MTNKNRKERAMKIRLFPSTFVKLILTLRLVFTKPSFVYFEAILSGIILERPRKTVTTAVKSLRLERPCCS